MTPTPQFALRTLPEIKAVLPEEYWAKYAKPVPKSVLKMLHGPGGGRGGSLVKVLASGGPQFSPTMSEEIWLTILDVRKRGREFVGAVNTVTGRQPVHGLNFGMQITFEGKHVIDVGLIGA